MRNQENKNIDISTTALRELIASEDKRYEQRFIDIKLATEAAFIAQKTAMEAAFAAQKTAMEAAFAAAEKVSNKTERATEDRFKAMDILLEQIRIQAMTFIPRQEWQITTNNFSDAIKKLEGHMATSLGAEASGTKNKSQNNWVIGIVISIVAVGVSLIIAFMQH